MQHALRVQERQHGDVCIAVLSEVHLDHAASLSNLRALFQGYHDADFVPLAIVLCGNFCGTRGADDAAHLARYEEGFAALAEILARFPRLLDETLQEESKTDESLTALADARANDKARGEAA